MLSCSIVQTKVEGKENIQDLSRGSFRVRLTTGSFPGRYRQKFRRESHYGLEPFDCGNISASSPCDILYYVKETMSVGTGTCRAGGLANDNRVLAPPSAQKIWAKNKGRA